MSIEQKAQQMAKLVAEIEDIERAKRETAKEFREQLTQRWKELEHLGGEITSGQRTLDDDEPLELGENVTVTGPDGEKLETRGDMRRAVGRSMRGGKAR